MAGHMRRASASSMTSINRPVSPLSIAESRRDPFDDDNATDYAESIQAPSEAPENPFVDPSVSSTSLTQNPFEPTDSHPSTRPSAIHRLSTRKSLTSRRAHAATDQNRNSTSSLNPSHPYRTHSTSSSASFAPSHAPSSSDDGPQHHYSTFDQATGVSRSTSYAASSAQRTSSIGSVRSRQAPAHPYALYPQDVSVVNPLPQAQIPVGFPGHTQNFQRRVGADGEEQDIVGSDGHAEQLPPYSRYPDESTGKTVAFGPMPRIGERSPSRDSLINSPQSTHRPGHEDVPLDDEDDEEDSSYRNAPATPLPAISEKPDAVTSWRDKSWKERGKQRVCCGFLPVWAILLFFAFIIAVIVICATIIRIFLNHDPKLKPTPPDLSSAHVSSSPSPPPPVTYYDAAPTATPTYLNPLPTGTFLVPLGAPDTIFGACLEEDQYAAWTCTLPKAESLCVHIVEGNGTGRAFLSTCNNGGEPQFGTQSPILLQQSLKLVTDLDQENLGPAWHFQTFYDKLAILPGNALGSAASSKSKREAHASWPWSSTGNGALSRDTSDPKQIDAGEQAWFCHWDDTFIEGFIYATVSNPLPTATSAVFSSCTTTSSSYAEPTSGGYGSYDIIYQRDDDDDHYRSSTTSIPQTTGLAVPTPTTVDPPASPSPSASKATNATVPVPPTPPPPVVMPQLVKFEERRLKGLHDSATCNLMLRLPNMDFVAVNGTDGYPIILTLNEDDGPIGASNNKMKRAPMYTTGGGAALERRQSRYVPSQVDETCFCQWTSETFE